MINNIYNGSTGGYINVVGGGSGIPYISPSHNNPAVGMVRVNGNTLEVFDGNGWLALAANSAEISLSQQAISALDWVTKKMHEETQLRALAENNVTVADALARYEEAQEQLRIILTLTDKS